MTEPPMARWLVAGGAAGRGGRRVADERLPQTAQGRSDCAGHAQPSLGLDARSADCFVNCAKRARL